jgi:hypothetical protein
VLVASAAASLRTACGPLADMLGEGPDVRFEGEELRRSGRSRPANASSRPRLADATTFAGAAIKASPLTQMAGAGSLSARRGALSQ